MNKKMFLVLVLLVLVAAIFVVIIFFDDGNETNASSIKIGAIMPLTGNVASYGIAIKHGIELALEDVNRTGLNGRKFSVIYEDSKADPKVGLSVAKKLVTIDRVNVIIGAVASSVTLAIAPYVERSKVVLLSAASSSPKITEAGEFVFRNYPSDDLEGKLVAEFAIKNGYHNAAIFTINNDYGNGLNPVFSERYKELGGEVLLNDKFLEGTNDFRTILQKIKTKNVDCIFIVGYGRELGTIVKQARELGIKSQFLSTVNFYDSETLTSGGHAVEGVIFSSPVFDPKSTASNIQQFVYKFKQKFNKEPDVWSAHGYDALLLIVEAIKKNGTDAVMIRDGLYSISNFDGVSGVTTFDKNGDVIKQAKFLTVKDGNFISYNRKGS